MHSLIDSSFSPPKKKVLRRLEREKDCLAPESTREYLTWVWFPWVKFTVKHDGLSEEKVGPGLPQFHTTWPVCPSKSKLHHPFNDACAIYLERFRGKLRVAWGDNQWEFNLISPCSSDGRSQAKNPSKVESENHFFSWKCLLVPATRGSHSPKIDCILQDRDGFLA